MVAAVPFPAVLAVRQGAAFLPDASKTYLTSSELVSLHWMDVQVCSCTLFHLLCKFLDRQRQFISGQCVVVKWQNILGVVAVQGN